MKSCSDALVHARPPSCREYGRESATIRSAGDGFEFEPAKFTQANIKAMPANILLSYQRAGISSIIDILNGLETMAFCIRKQSKEMGEEIAKARAAVELLLRFAAELEIKTSPEAETEPETESNERHFE